MFKWYAEVQMAFPQFLLKLKTKGTYGLLLYFTLLQILHSLKLHPTRHPFSLLTVTISFFSNVPKFH